MERSKFRLLMISIPFIIAFATLGVIGLFTTSYSTVSDVVALKDVSRVSVMGNVTQGSVRYNGSHTIFMITDGSSFVKVVYKGILQLDNSTNYAQVTVYGVYYPDAKVIKADNVLFKCPSKEEIKSYSD